MIRNRYHIVVLILVAVFAMSGNSVAQNVKRQVDMVPTRRELSGKGVAMSQNTQNDKKDKSAKSTSVAIKEEEAPKGQTNIYLEHAEVLVFDKDRLPGVQILIGNVRFRHDDVYLYCDSAYFYDKTNSCDAFSHVKIVQGDTLFIYGDVLYYDGNAKLARLRKHVKMETKTAVLTTDSLNYDRTRNVGYYFTGGKLMDKLNVLVSQYGYYYTDAHKAVFRKNVKLTNPNFLLVSDTLHYNTNTKIADIIGPTNIDYEKDTHIYSEKGWYDTGIEYAELLDNSYVENQQSKRLIGDTIYYDKKLGFGQAYQNIELADTLKKISLFGNYGYYNEKTAQGMVTDSAMMVEYSSADTLYLHGDTLYTYSDSIYNVVEAFHHVRFYRDDIQGVCDSLAYLTRDSTLQMMYDPVVWSDYQQVLGDTIRVYMRDSVVDRAHVIGSAFACQRKDKVHYNQIVAKEFWAYMTDGSLTKIEANGNAQVIYYPVDEADGEYIGLNSAMSSYMNAYFKDRKLDRMVMYPSPSGTLYPMDKLTDAVMYFSQFVWKGDERPMDKYDIFRIVEKKVDVADDGKKKRKRSRNSSSK